MTDERKEAVTSNTDECFYTFLGQKMIGALLGTTYPGGPEFVGMLVFEDGRGFGFHGTGSFTVVSKKDVQRAIDFRKKQLQKSNLDLQRILDLADQVSSSPSPKTSSKKRSLDSGHC